MNQPETNSAATHHPRGIGKKIALICAVSSGTCGFLTLGAALWAWETYGTHVYTASLGATTFFFVTAAIVLYEMSRRKPILPQKERFESTD
ncbi:MAG: hypothetical protein Q8M20_11590 [Rhodocyclaceae bacterium]|nr:hypothetical protein [Rhodocyclaceae bacterium]MDZ4215302.1 hypothetical protein [Rhodocyclaceae bacterium]